jgi:tRNA dimethylallyltransferase
VAILGPTASGKTRLAVEIALQFNGEVVNCDSLQLYRGFDIGTAKPSAAERRGVPHHLLDVIDPDRDLNAGDYARLATEALARVRIAGRLPVIAGGTGFYLRALLDGLAEAPPRDEALRIRLQERGDRRAGLLFRALRGLDPVTAGKIHPNDTNKLIRAIEMCVLSGKPASKLFAAPRTGLRGFRVKKLGLDPPRPDIHARIAERSRAMFESGLVEEVASLLQSGVPKSAKPFESLGYKEALAVIDGRMSVPEAIERTAIATRQYAKRQLTWFRREADVQWLQGFGADPRVRGQALDGIRAFLSGAVPSAP